MSSGGDDVLPALTLCPCISFEPFVLFCFSFSLWPLTFRLNRSKRTISRDFESVPIISQTERLLKAALKNKSHFHDDIGFIHCRVT